MLYMNGFKIKFSYYIVMYMKHIAILTICLVITCFVLNHFELEANMSLEYFVFSVVVYNGLFLVILFGFSFCVLRSFRSFLYRFLNKI